MQIAELVATEFFEQGDKERRELNIEPIVSTVTSGVIVFCVIWDKISPKKYNKCCSVPQGSSSLYGLPASVSSHYYSTQLF